MVVLSISKNTSNQLVKGHTEFNDSMMFPWKGSFKPHHKRLIQRLRHAAACFDHTLRPPRHGHGTETCLIHLQSFLWGASMSHESSNESSNVRSQQNECSYPNLSKRELKGSENWVLAAVSYLSQELYLFAAKEWWCNWLNRLCC